MNYLLYACICGLYNTLYLASQANYLIADMFSRGNSKSINGLSLVENLFLMPPALRLLETREAARWRDAAMPRYSIFVILAQKRGASKGILSVP